MSMDFEAFKQVSRLQLKLDFTGYRDSQIQRRLNTFMQRKGFPDFRTLLKHLQSNPSEIGDLRDYLAINVSEFFRNPEMFQYLGKDILPKFGKKSNLKIWSAGCSVGCEAYTLGILASKQFPGGSWSILATDIDGEAILAAEAGSFSYDLMKLVPKDYLAKYFRKTSEDIYTVKDSLKQKIRFQRKDLFKDPFPSGVDLIVCRNVVIYFTEEAKSNVFSRISQSLNPGGVLFIGATESFHDYRKHNLQRLEPCFYQKI